MFLRSTTRKKDGKEHRYYSVVESVRWRSLNFDSFWSPKLGVSREGTDWTSLLQVSVIYRLVAPGSGVAAPSTVV